MFSQVSLATTLDRPRRWLVGLGALSILLGVAMTGAIADGYSKSGGALLTHAGLLVLLLAGTAALLERAPPDWPAGPRALAAAVAAVLALYPLAIALIWYDLVLTPPPHYSGEPALVGFAVDRLAFVLALAPVALGYPVGVASVGDGTESILVGGLSVLLAVGGVASAYVLLVAQGAHPGFTFLFVLLLGLADVGGAIPVAIIGRATDK